MTVAIEECKPATVLPSSRENGLAPWRLRAYAVALDVLAGTGVITTMVLVSFTVPSATAWWWMCVSLIGAVILLMLVNRLLLPTVTGWSVGRALCGIVVVRRDGAAVGAWGLLLRELAHLLDVATVLVGWLWPLWDSRHRTFADLVLRTEVRCVEPGGRPHNARRWAAVAVLAAAGMALSGAAMSYGVVYSHDRAVDRTRAQIAVQGPRMVAQMLTYDPKSLHDDFARAQSLATDKYRGQLAVQQEAVQKGHPVINEYWVTDSSIQSATPKHATMLLFMQGRRGEPPDERYISATVRVGFANEGGNQWRVDDLTVLTKPKPAGDGK